MLTLHGMNPPDLNTKPGRIQYAIEQSGHNPNSIAPILGVTASAIYQWLEGKTKNLKEDAFWKLCDLSGLEARWVSQGEGPMKIEKSIKHAQQVLMAMQPEARYTAVRLIDTLAEPEKKTGSE